MITGDRHLQSPREGDLLRRDHRVHGLGQRGQAPRHHQARDTSDDTWDVCCVNVDTDALEKWYISANCLQWVVWVCTQILFKLVKTELRMTNW